MNLLVVGVQKWLSISHSFLKWWLIVYQQSIRNLTENSKLPWKIGFRLNFFLNLVSYTPLNLQISQFNLGENLFQSYADHTFLATKIGADF